MKILRVFNKDKKFIYEIKGDLEMRELGNPWPHEIMVLTDSSDSGYAGKVFIRHDWTFEEIEE